MSIHWPEQPKTKVRWVVKPNDIIGKRYSWVQTPEYPDVTFASFADKVLPGQTKPCACVSAHATTGNVQWLPLKSVLRLIQKGLLVESDKGGPVTVERTRRAW